MFTSFSTIPHRIDDLEKNILGDAKNEVIPHRIDDLENPQYE